MKRMILYGSKYGSSRNYAEKLSEQTNIPAFSFEQAPSFKNIDTFIYIGSLYVGGVLGLSKFIRKIKDDQHLILVTVGLADPTIEENATNIKNKLRQLLGSQLFDRSKIFHLRGAINYQQLSFIDRMLMKLLYKSISRKSFDNLTSEDKALVETYNKKVNFIDYDALKVIIEELQA